MGFSSTLDDALSQSVEHAINMITAMFEMPRQQVYLLLSAAIDFDVTQAVDITKGVHGLIDLSMFQQLPDYERTIRKQQMDCHAAHALLAQQAQTSHWLISPKNSIREWNNRRFP